MTKHKSGKSNRELVTEVLAKAKAPVGIAEICEAIKGSKRPTISALMAQQAARGAFVRAAEGKYRLPTASETAKRPAPVGQLIHTPVPRKQVAKKGRLLASPNDADEGGPELNYCPHCNCHLRAIRLAMKIAA